MPTIPYAQVRQPLMNGDPNQYADITPGSTQDIQATGSGMTSTDNDNLLKMLMTPSNVGTDPGEQKPNRLAQVLLGLGDSLNAYASVLGNAPQIRSHGLSDYQVYLQSQRDLKQRYNERKQAAEQASKQDTARYLLSQNERKQMRADDQAGRQELKQMQIDQNKEALRQAKELADQKASQDQAQFEAQKTWEKQKMEWQGNQDMAIAKIHERSKVGDKSAEYDQKVMPEIMSNISGLVDVAQTSLSGGDPNLKIPGMNKQQMVARVRRLVEGSMLSPDAKKAVYAFSERELGQAIRDFETEQAAQSQQGTTVPDAPYKENLGYKMLNSVGLGPK